MKAESQMPRTGEIKKQTEIYCNNIMQVFLYSATLSDGLESYLGKEYKKKKVQEGKFVSIHKIYYFLLNGRLTSIEDYHFPLNGDKFKGH